MSKSSLFLVASCAAALTLGACAGNSDSESSVAARSSLTAEAPAPQPPAAAPSETTTAQAETPAQPATYTDEQLRHFVAAATEIQPITQSLQTATPEQRTAAAEQLRAILTRHNLDGATYNAIAAQAQSDPAFAARITALSQSTAPQG